MSWRDFVIPVAAAACVGYGLYYAYGTGYRNGETAADARHDKAAVAELRAILKTNAEQTDQANQASAELRGLIASIDRRDSRTSKELHDALQKTAADRAGCRFDDDSLRLLDAARERAAAAAALGLRRTAPAAAGAER